MRRIRLLALVAFVVGCAHAKHVEKPPEEQRRETPAPKGTKKPATPTRPGQPPVAATPAGLLKKDSLEEIQRALAGRGYLPKYEPGEMDEATTAAVRKFQKDHELAQTGMPDHETVRRLGLDPEKIYKAAAPAKQAP